ncbi:transposase [Streptomyces mirabilis]|uniref:transposase n=1 Tax=Streptomyces mirabilis TaxID=68239 RepID=UPI00371A2DC8
MCAPRWGRPPVRDADGDPRACTATTSGVWRRTDSGSDGSHTRSTIVLTTQLTDTALFPGGRAGANLCGRTAVTTCKDTQLRLLHAPPVLLPEPVPYLGVDEFAVRRGRTYATILVDTNTHRPSDALADRTAHTSTAWLREHPRGADRLPRPRRRNRRARMAAAPGCPAPPSATSRSTNASNAATAREPSPVNSTSAAAPSCASPGPPIPST